MKIKSFFATAMAVLVFLACNNEVVSPLPDNPDAEPQASGYLILNLINPPATRTSVGDDGTDQSVGDESKINDLKMVFTNKGGVISHVIEPVVTDGLSAKFEVVLGVHYVYALVNSPFEVETGDNINRIINLAAASEAISGYKNGSFLMINKCNSSSENAGVRVSITENHSINNPAKVDIHVDRVVSKIYDSTTNPAVTALATATDGFVDAVDIAGFVLLNMNKDFNLIQVWNDENELNEDVLSTPLYAAGVELIADQYFCNIGDYTTLVKSGNSITSLTDETINSPDLFGAGPVYTTENRPAIVKMGGDEITSGRGETTGVIYKVQAKKGSDNLSTFYKYNNELYEDLTVINDFPQFSEINIETKTIPELRGLGINVYEDGVMYYTYYIRDPNIAHQYGGENYYAVFRNSSYKLAINKITMLGDDVPGGGVVNPAEDGAPGNPPIDRKEAYIDVALTVSPWVLNIMGIDF